MEGSAICLHLGITHKPPSRAVLKLPASSANHICPYLVQCARFFGTGPAPCKGSMHGPTSLSVSWWPRRAAAAHPPAPHPPNPKPSGRRSCSSPSSPLAPRASHSRRSFDNAHHAHHLSRSHHSQLPSCASPPASGTLPTVASGFSVPHDGSDARDQGLGSQGSGQGLDQGSGQGSGSRPSRSVPLPREDPGSGSGVGFPHHLHHQLQPPVTRRNTLNLSSLMSMFVAASLLQLDGGTAEGAVRPRGARTGHGLRCSSLKLSTLLLISAALISVDTGNSSHVACATRTSLTRLSHYGRTSPHFLHPHISPPHTFPARSAQRAGPGRGA